MNHRWHCYFSEIFAPNFHHLAAVVVAAAAEAVAVAAIAAVAAVALSLTSFDCLLLHP